MKDAIDYAFLAAVAVSAATASGHAVIYKRDSRSASIWVLLIWILPAVGPVLYALLGVNRVGGRAARMRRGMVRHRTAPAFPPSEPGTHFTPPPPPARPPLGLPLVPCHAPG